MVTPDVVAVGGVSLDWVVTANGELSLRNCGGNAVYAAVGARLWTDRVAIVGRAGNDYPSTYLSDLAEAGIDTSAIQRVAERHERVYAVRFNAHGERHTISPPEFFPSIGINDPDVLEDHVLFHEPSDREVIRRFDPRPDEIPRHFWQARGFHVARMHRQSELDFASQLASRSIFFSLDSDCVNCSESDRRAILRLTPALLPSESDVKALLGDWDSDPDEALYRLGAMGPPIVAIKTGQQGSVFIDAASGLRRRVPVFPTTAKDPTGAGDSYCGGFLAGYLETGDVFEAALRGTVSASFAIEDFDARYALQFGRPTAEARLRSLRTLA
jgi:ribokinase